MDDSNSLLIPSMKLPPWFYIVHHSCVSCVLVQLSCLCPTLSLVLLELLKVWAFSCKVKLCKVS